MLLYRRQFIQSSLGLSAAGLAGCAVDSALRSPRALQRGMSPLPFAQPVIDAARIREVRVGLRPFRAPGFVVDAERLDGKTLVHHYGHGGAGITLFWGSAILAADLAPDVSDKRAIVVGAGVIGLSTARALQLRGWRVNIVTKDRIEDTTSHIAGGHFAPTAAGNVRGADAAFLARLDAALQGSFDHFAVLAGKAPGVSWRENYQLDEPGTAARIPFYVERWPRWFPGARKLDTREHPFGNFTCFTYQALFIEPPCYLSALRDDFFASGGQMSVRVVASREALASLEAPLIVNCTGLGAKALLGDDNLIPVRGQLVLLEPDPRIDFCLHGGHADALTYLFPRSDALVLGGSFERGNANLDIDTGMTNAILQRHANVARAMQV